MKKFELVDDSFPPSFRGPCNRNQGHLTPSHETAVIRVLAGRIGTPENPDKTGKVEELQTCWLGFPQIITCRASDMLVRDGFNFSLTSSSLKYIISASLLGRFCLGLLSLKPQRSRSPTAGGHRGVTVPCDTEKRRVRPASLHNPPSPQILQTADVG
ncbi:hypothetical protein RRG08_040697 [Elysia crispata]|uniref:Uncharacterized protein n=1 Tax=Elysia crispata TaxID=231223 RepID=A0AAE1E6M1_9GAST|nr:hypothetical protein RRG08_040697 [Elysia crispata]